MPGKTTDDIYNEDMAAIYGVAEPTEEEEEPAEEETPVEAVPTEEK